MSIKVILGAIFGLMAIWVIPVVQVQAAEDFQISYSCINCHQDRYEEWGRSMHALAVSDPVFQAAYMRALQSDPKYRQYCLTCHSPTTVITNDLNMTKSVSIEGVTCSFCHSVTGIENNRYIFNQSNIFRGPYNDSKTGAHGSAYSELLTKSEFCAGCHEFSINGVPVYQTYSEWKEGPYAAEGKQCQDCHMEAKPGIAAKNGSIREKVYKHFWYGGHSGQFMEKAVQMDSIVQQKENKVKVTVNITNSNVGHKIPSGFPSRKVVLSLKASDKQGKHVFSDQRIYAKTLVDTYGNEVDDFWKAASIARDNRIKPKETRTEVFEFKVPDGTGEIDIQTKLIYQLEVEIISRTRESMNVEIANNRTAWLNGIGIAEAAAEMTPSSKAQSPPGSLAITITVVLLGAGLIITIIAIIAVLYISSRRK